MKASIILLFVSFILFSCESNRTYNFDCTCDYTFTAVDNTSCPNLINSNVKGIILQDNTYAQVRSFEQPTEGYFLISGVLYHAKKTNCNCVPTYCPEYRSTDGN
jgi:hypothetical protein